MATIDDVTAEVRAPSTRNARLGVKGFVRRALEDRFWERVIRTSADDCWMWTGALAGKGYGRILVNGKPRPAHQVAWELAHGAAFPEGREGCHTCDTPRCVNPRHIRPGTHSENLKEAYDRGLVSRRKLRRKRTVCEGGLHELTPENTKVSASGNRSCRTCARAYDRNRRARIKAARAALEGSESP